MYTTLLAVVSLSSSLAALVAKAKEQTNRMKRVRFKPVTRLRKMRVHAKLYLYNSLLHLPKHQFFSQRQK
jgi:hypothetical protein